MSLRCWFFSSIEWRTLEAHEGVLRAVTSCAAGESFVCLMNLHLPSTAATRDARGRVSPCRPVDAAVMQYSSVVLAEA
jgi:hypothetical protein